MQPSLCGGLAILLFTASVSGCAKEDAAQAAGAAVISSGKTEALLDEIPTEVLAAAAAVKPDLKITGAEYETRNGAEYYDVAGTVGGGEEIELDLTKIDGVWTVVEIQRDIAESQAPGYVLAALRAHKPDFNIKRIIESDQGDGVVIIYEFYRETAEGGLEKAEVKAENGTAEFLTEEWVH